MRRRDVASTSVRRHVPAGICPPPAPTNILNPCPQYSKHSYAYENVMAELESQGNLYVVLCLDQFLAQHSPRMTI